jgi:hypothetical protein
MEATDLCGQAVTIIDPHSRYYGAVVIVKAVQEDLARQTSTLLASGRETGELELKLTDVTTKAKRKFGPQTELFI